MVQTSVKLRLNHHLSQWGVAYILLALFLSSWYFQYLTQWEEFVQEQIVHGEPISSSQFVIEFWRSTLENWQSEFLQLLVQAVLVASYFQSKLFRAEYSADKEDVEKILQAIRER